MTLLNSPSVMLDSGAGTDCVTRRRAAPSNAGWPASTKPIAASATINIGIKDSTLKYVMDAA